MIHEYVRACKERRRERERGWEGFGAEQGREARDVSNINDIKKIRTHLLGDGVDRAGQRRVRRDGLGGDDARAAQLCQGESALAPNAARPARDDGHAVAQVARRQLHVRHVRHGRTEVVGI